MKAHLTATKEILVRVGLSEDIAEVKTKNKQSFVRVELPNGRKIVVDITGNPNWQENLERVLRKFKDKKPVEKSK